jgi:hypothetical protein
MPVRAAVLVALDEDSVTARNQQASRRVAREVVIQCQIRAPERRVDMRLRDPREARGRRRFVNEPGLEDLVQMAEGADAPPSAPVGCGVARRVAYARTELFGVGAAPGEAGRWLFAADGRIARRRRG